MITNILLIALIAVMEFFHLSERKDLLNRIQAKDFTEYKVFETKPKKKKEEEKPKEYEFL